MSSRRGSSRNRMSENQLILNRIREERDTLRVNYHTSLQQINEVTGERNNAQYRIQQLERYIKVLQTLLKENDIDYPQFNSNESTPSTSASSSVV